MLTFSAEQMQKYKQDREEDWSIPNLCQYLRKNYSYASVNQLSDKELTKRVRLAVKKAHSYGMQSERDIYDFVTLELTQYPNFHQHKKVQDLLQGSGGHPKMRMYWLAQQIPASVWQEVC